MEHEVVSREQWLTARRELLLQEKEFTKRRDQLNARRRELPWIKVEKNYVFDGPNGKETLADLFAGRGQLVVKHFMFGPGWEQGCIGCSFGTDNVSGALVHLEHHDVSYAMVSRAPFAELDAFRRRMGWNVKWVSSYGGDFNYDFNVSFHPEDIAAGKAFYNYRMTDQVIEEMPGLSVFYKTAAGDIMHTYSTFARGAELSLAAYGILDLTPLGRNENGPNFVLTDWVKLHDQYDDAGSESCCAHE
jgi:predicted dithiol-disulfide oxidoreductase (DUF899 family)